MFKNRASKKAGLPPGTMVYVGKEQAGEATVSMIQYSEQEAEEVSVDVRNLQIAVPENKDRVTWIQVTGVHDLALVENLGRIFELHPLVMEDIVHTMQRLKVEDYGDYIFAAMRAMHPYDEQICLILGPGYVISFQENPSPLFDSIKERIMKGKGRIRRLGAGYLCYALMDIVVDSHYHVMESINERLEALQEDALEDYDRETIHGIHALKGEVFRLRKSVWPLREMIGRIQRSDSGLVTRDVSVFFRDVLDHAAQLADTVENFREMLASIQDTQLSSLSNKMNDVMRVLTVISTIFIPMTFLAGIYGMNFKYMPELEWKAAYPVFWIIVIIMGLGMVWWFKKKKWL
ncbi:magnesium and cobalt transport protein CorA [Desulfatibacillum aliphaticivorans]|uniref:Magnesium transport protein CorA n=1 Tax=Desulfatibacillum aliphaticivorans TaxID=218208 RepID=B8FG37_DESAL|nr:magnesium/cobalt transporter CorA [Desulfatibacillum aliphaticivorans]ACL03717.1 magnesium and cobalt transport protein CorA [Desulfatibacillum aliphaticivorans]